MEENIDTIREFNRYYTNALGLLNAHFLNSKYSLTEARLIFEIGHTKNCTASHLVQLLNLDKGYLSRTLKQFEREGIVTRTKNKLDTRILNLSLTQKGKTALSKLNHASNSQIGALIEGSSDLDKRELVSSMQNIRRILSKKESPVLIRESKVGDLGYIIHRHALLYEAEYEFNFSFEHYVIHGVSDYLKTRSELDKVWIAEHDNKIIGAIAMVHASDKIAQLRWFYAERNYRNLGVGKKLLTTALEYGQENFSQLFLWTLSNLPAARNLYKSFGFNLTESKQNDIWKPDLIEEKWELEL